MEVDWQGRVLWEVKHPEHHHDGIRLKNGNIMLLCATELPAAIVRQVKGGRPGTEFDGGKMLADYLVEMTTGGDIVWEWRSWEHLDPAEDVLTAVQDVRDEWTHGNTISETPDGDLILSFRNISTVIMVERGSGRIKWKLGAPPLSGQHAPHILANGHMLLFDNGPHRLDETFPFSRVLEIEVATQGDPLEIPGGDPPELLQSAHLECGAAAERQHPHQRGKFRPLLRGDARGRGGVGIRQSAFRRVGEARDQRRVPRPSLLRGRGRAGAQRAVGCGKRDGGEDDLVPL